MAIIKYLGMRTQKEQSDKSSGEESDTEESLCCADKSKTSMTASSLINYLHNRRRNLHKKVKLQESLGESLSLGSV